MDAPLIGITTYPRNTEGKFTLPAAYVECVRRVGGIPVLLAPGETRLEDWLETVDGLILSGGGDISPELYDGAAHPSIAEVDIERDRDEVALVHLAVEAEIPLLAICRGMQVLNVAFGGDLFAHIPEDIDGAIDHRRCEGEATVALPHDVVLDPGSRLASVFGVSRMAPMSLHHQAIDEVGDGLQVVGHAPDGVIEAVESSEHPWLFGVQWHPEWNASEDPTQQRLFAALIGAARGD